MGPVLVLLRHAGICLGLHWACLMPRLWGRHPIEGRLLRFLGSPWWGHAIE